MRKFKPVPAIGLDAELTTQQAADFLNVSRPFLIGLLDKRAIEHRKVGRHRRIKFGDLLAFDEASRIKRAAAIDDMAAEARRLNLD